MCYSLLIMETQDMHEQLSRENYALLQYEAIEQLRASQRTVMQEAGDKSVEALPTPIDAFNDGARVHEQAAHSVTDQLDQKIVETVSNSYDKGSDPELYALVLQTLTAVSSQHMTDEKWYNGDPNSDGKYDNYESSGRCQVEKLLNSLRNGGTNDEPEETPESPNGSPFDHDSPEFKAANTALESARTTFAKLSVEGRHRSLKNGKKSKAFAAQLHQAHDVYQTAQTNIFGMYIAGYRAQGHSDEVIGEKLMPEAVKNAIKEQGVFTEAEQNYLLTDNSLRSRATRYLSTKGKLFGLSAVSGFAIGTGMRVLSKSTAALAVGVAGGATAGALLGARAAKGALLSRLKSGVALHKEVGVRAAKDKGILESHLSGISGRSIEDVHKVVGSVGAIALNRVEKDRKTNRNRTAISMALGAGAAALAFELVPEITEFFGGYHETPEPPTGTVDHTPTLTPPTVATPPKPIDTYGFKPNYSVKNGEGYGQVFKDLAQEQGVHFDGYSEFLKFAHEYPNVKIFSDNNSYAHAGGARIAHAGASHFSPDFLAAFHQQLVEEGKIAA